MSSRQIDSTNLTFAQAKHRPVVRIVNWVGRRAQPFGWDPILSPELIIRDAQRQSRLNDDIDEAALGALSRLVDAFDREAGLTTFGRLYIRFVLARMVETRLRMRDYLRHHPEAQEAALLPPLIVVGMPRTGTTLLYSLLAQDPSSRPILGWEALMPVPLGSKPGRADPRPRLGRWVERGIHRLNIGLDRIHPFVSDGPEECTWIMGATLVAMTFSLLGRIPSYMDWLWDLDDATWAHAYRDYRDLLLILQHQRGGARWVLKSPMHLMSLGPLLQAIPSAKIILTDRDPLEVVPSNCSLFGVLRAVSVDRIDAAALGSEMLDLLARCRDRTEPLLEQYPDRVMRVSFRDLVSDKLGTIRAIYDRFGLELTAETEGRMNHWISNDSFHPAHRYRLEQFGLSEQRVRDRFARIQP